MVCPRTKFISSLTIQRGICGSAPAMDWTGTKTESSPPTAWDMKGNVWVGTSMGLQAFRDGAFHMYGEESGLPRRLIGSLAEDRAGHLWVGTEVGVFRSKQPIQCAEKSCAPQFIQLQDDSVRRAFARVIHEDREGGIWIGTSLDGLVKYRDGRFTSYTTKDGLADNAVRGLNADRDGSLWIATRGGGLTRFKNGKFTTYSI